MLTHPSIVKTAQSYAGSFDRYKVTFGPGTQYAGTHYFFSLRAAQAFISRAIERGYKPGQ